MIASIVREALEGIFDADRLAEQRDIELDEQNTLYLALPQGGDD